MTKSTLLRASDIIKELKISKRTLHYLKSKGLPSYQPTPKGAVWYDLAECEAWIRSHRTPLSEK